MSDVADGPQLRRNTVNASSAASARHPGKTGLIPLLFSRNVNNVRDVRGCGRKERVMFGLKHRYNAA